jgi:hypothetical protein
MHADNTHNKSSKLYRNQGCRICLQTPMSIVQAFNTQHHLIDQVLRTLSAACFAQVRALILIFCLRFLRRLMKKVKDTSRESS